MRTLTKPEIDVIDVKETKDGYIVKYWDENFDGDNNVEMQISKDALLDHVAEHYGSEFYTTTRKQDSDYLTENRDEIIKDYIQANS